MVRVLLLAGVALFALYAGVMVLLHPRFIYPFASEPFLSDSFQRQELGPDGPVVYAHDAGAGAPLIVYYMGNAGALSLFEAMLDHHRRAGRSVVALAYRGGGGIDGTPSEAALKADALAAFDAAPGLLASPPGAVLLQGYSLGTGLALAVAARRTADGVILSAPYASLCRLMARASYLPACWLPGVQAWRSDRDAAQVTVPVMVLHGTADTLIPIAEGRRLAAALPGDASFVEIPGSGHLLIDDTAYLQAIDRFVDQF